jgi:phosphoribosyl 1,2-cyclic phosphodiesterase
MKSDEARLLVLRRWNSYTPRIPSAGGRSIGGGYYLEWRGYGLAVDPGFDFLDNMEVRGVPVDAVRGVAVSHSHIDHTSDLEPLLMMKALLMDRHKKAAADERLDLFFDFDTVNKFASMIQMQQQAGVTHAPLTLRPGSPVRTEGCPIEIVPIRADHSKTVGLPQDNAVGMVFNLLDAGGTTVCSVGYTGDTRYIEGNADALRKCDVVVCHLGEVNLREVIAAAKLHLDETTQELPDVLREGGFKTETEEALLSKILHRSREESWRDVLAGGPTERKSAHLGFDGVARLCASLSRAGSRTKLAIVSEFGEELGSYRHKIAHALRMSALSSSGRLQVMTGDVKLGIRIAPSAIPCANVDCSQAGTVLVECGK